jgi:hypothetical protein
LIGSSEYAPDDSDWACAEVFTTREDLFITDEVVGKKWEDVLCFFKSEVGAYLENGRYKDKLLSKAAVGIGFVDGDLEILYEQTI